MCSSILHLSSFAGVPYCVLEFRCEKCVFPDCQDISTCALVTKKIMLLAARLMEIAILTTVHRVDENVCRNCLQNLKRGAVPISSVFFKIHRLGVGGIEPG